MTNPPRCPLCRTRHREIDMCPASYKEPDEVVREIDELRAKYPDTPAARSGGAMSRCPVCDGFWDYCACETESKPAEAECCGVYDDCSACPRSTLPAESGVREDAIELAISVMKPAPGVANSFLEKFLAEELLALKGELAEIHGEAQSYAIELVKLRRELEHMREVMRETGAMCDQAVQERDAALLEQSAIRMELGQQIAEARAEVERLRALHLERTKHADVWITERDRFQKALEQIVEEESYEYGETASAKIARKALEKGEG